MAIEHLRPLLEAASLGPLAELPAAEQSPMPRSQCCVLMNAFAKGIGEHRTTPSRRAVRRHSGEEA